MSDSGYRTPDKIVKLEAAVYDVTKEIHQASLERDESITRALELLKKAVEEVTDWLAAVDRRLEKLEQRFPNP